MTASTTSGPASKALALYAVVVDEQPLVRAPELLLSVIRSQAFVVAHETPLAL